MAGVFAFCHLRFLHPGWRYGTERSLPPADRRPGSFLRAPFCSSHPIHFRGRAPGREERTAVRPGKRRKTKTPSFPSPSSHRTVAEYFPVQQSVNTPRPHRCHPEPCEGPAFRLRLRSGGLQAGALIHMAKRPLPAARADHHPNVAPGFAPLCEACLLRPGRLYRELPAFLRGEPGNESITSYLKTVVISRP